VTARLNGRVTGALRAAAAAALLVLLASSWWPVAAQTPARPPARPVAARPERGVRVRAFGDAGARWFAASQTFDAVFGSSIGPLFGGGVEVLWNQHLAVDGSVLVYHGSGERVFVSGGQVFPLGIPAKATVMPIAATVSYRFANPRSQTIPFIGGGITWHRLTESSDFAGAGEDVSDTFTGFHVQGGAEWRLTRHVGLAGVGRWSTVRNALGTEPTSAATVFGEHDLGGFDATVRSIIGRR
jgi:opacity protein-like surface antigen